MTNLGSEEWFERACICFRERRFDEAKAACDIGLAQSHLPTELRIEFLLLHCDVLQAFSPIDWKIVFESAEEAENLAADLREPTCSLRSAQACNRMGVAIRARCMIEPNWRFDARIEWLRSAGRHHNRARKILAELDVKSLELDQRELHSVIVSAYNNYASALVEQAYLNEQVEETRAVDDQDFSLVRRLLEEALEQFSSCRYACDGLVPEARVATLNDEAEVLLRLSRVCGQEPDVAVIAFYRCHRIVYQALELLEEINDRRVRLSWEWVFRAKLRWSMEHEMKCSSQLAQRFLADTFSTNEARLDELSEPEQIMYQFATVDVYYTPWSPSLGGGRSHDGSAEIRLGRALERLRLTFSERHRLNTAQLRDSSHGLHLDELRVALDAAVELSEAATICEVIETCRAQGYTAVPVKQAMPVGDVVDSSPNRALAAIGIATVGSPPDLFVKGSSVVHQHAEQSIEVDHIRQLTAGTNGWWWSLLRCRDAIYWAVLTPDTQYGGRCDAPDDMSHLVPWPIIDELIRRRRCNGPPLPLCISPSSGLASIGWGTLPVGEEAGSYLVQHADLRIAPPVPLLAACLKRPTSHGPWPITLLVAADPDGDLSAQAALPEHVANLMDKNCLILRFGMTAPPGRAELREAVDEIQYRGSRGTLVYSGHGVSDGRDAVEDFGLRLYGNEKLRARDIINWAKDAEEPMIPARVLLAACKTIGVRQTTNEWTSIAPAALFAGAEIVLATCQDLTSDDVNLHATAELCDILYSSACPIADFNNLQRSHLADIRPLQRHPSLSYSAIVGYGESLVDVEGDQLALFCIEACTETARFCRRPGLRDCHGAATSVRRCMSHGVRHPDGGTDRRSRR
jgi:hypothetical protein